MEISNDYRNKILTNNAMEQVNKETKCSRIDSRLPKWTERAMPECKGLFHARAFDWGTKRYLNMNYLFERET